MSTICSQIKSRLVLLHNDRQHTLTYTPLAQDTSNACIRIRWKLIRWRGNETVAQQQQHDEAIADERDIRCRYLRILIRYH